MAKNFKKISNAFIDDTNLSKIDLHISVPGYLKEEISHFIEISTKDNIEKVAQEVKVSDSKEDKKR